VNLKARDFSDMPYNSNEYELISSSLAQNESLLTILIPTYNSAIYLPETLLRATQLEDTRIIIVDDSSNDETLHIAESVLTGHPNYIILRAGHKGSPGFARNLGIQLASSKWIWFLDSDDIPILDSWGHMLETSLNNNCDVIILKYLIRYDPNFVWTGSYDEEIFRKLCNEPFRILNSWVSSPDIVRLSPHPSRAIYSVAFLRKNVLSFDENENFEDGSFWPKMLLRANQIMLWNWPQVVYRVRRNSITYSNEIGRKLFLLSQFKKNLDLDFFCEPPNSILMGSLLLYSLEMISWPLNELKGRAKSEYKKAGKSVLTHLDREWYQSLGSQTNSERFYVMKTLWKFGAFKKLYLIPLVK